MPTDQFEIYHTGKVRDGKLEGIPKKKLSSELNYFEGKTIELIIRRKRKYRSIQQNRVQWWYYRELGDYMGLRPYEVHEICRMKFLKSEAANEQTGEIYEYLKSTTDLSTTEHNEYTSQIRQWAAELGVNLPEPNEQIDLL